MAKIGLDELFVDTFSDGGVSLNYQVAFPSSMRLHQWGSNIHLSSLAAPAIPPPRSPSGPRTQRSISHAFPLYSAADEQVKPATTFGYRPPTASILSILSGAGSDSPRLRPFDRTRHQPKHDASRATSYTEAFCQPASKRLLPPISKKSAVASVDKAGSKYNIGDAF